MRWKGAAVVAYSAGMLVRHATLGLGKVVAVDPVAVHVFFAEGERRAATKLSLAAAGPFLSAAPEAVDARLVDLPAFVLDPVSRRYAPGRAAVAKVRRARAAKR